MKKACLISILGFGILLASLSTVASKPIVIASYYRADIPFPEFSHFWQEAKPFEQVGSGEKQRLGGSLHVFFRNPEIAAVKIEDILLESVSLKQAIAFSDARKFKRSKIQAANIYFSDLSQPELQTLIAAGEPIWWRVEPSVVNQNQTAELIVRLRQRPKADSIKLTIRSSSDTLGLSIPITEEAPRLESISFSSGLKQVFIYASHPQVGRTPVKVFIDGMDISNKAVIGKDPRTKLWPVVCSIETPLSQGSFHVFQVLFDDNSAATAGIRAYEDELRYGMWGGKPGQETELAVGRAWLNEMAIHNINLQMEMIGSAAVAQFMKTEEGRRMMQDLGIKRVVGEPEKDPSPHAYYLADEPDAADSRVPNVPSTSKVGSLAQGLAAWADQLRTINVSVPTMVNVDMTYKPNNWYIYGQLADIYAADPYFQTRLAEVYFSKPRLLPLYSKATFVYAVGSICRSACAPRPLHLILNCTKRQEKDKAFRFGTPAEKRIEVFYALASGAKHLSYWWYLPLPPQAEGSCGLGTNDPDAKALWTEIGLLGAEVRTAGPLIARSCPTHLDISCSPYIWARALLAGLDSMILLCVNDDYACDRVGTVYKPIENAQASVSLPAWLNPKDVFEINASGTRDVTWDQADGKLNIRLGTLELTRLIVITSSPTLRDTLQKLYDQKFAGNVKALLSQ